VNERRSERLNNRVDSCLERSLESEWPGSSRFRLGSVKEGCAVSTVSQDRSKDRIALVVGRETKSWQGVKTDETQRVYA
jgi:hypothetical protein